VFIGKKKISYIIVDHREAGYIVISLLTTVKKVSCRFMVSEWLTQLAATLEVMSSRPSLGDISEIYSLESILSLA